MVSGSTKVASSRQSESFFKLGLPANKSSTEPTIVSWSGESWIPGAQVMVLLVRSRPVVDGTPV